MSEERKIYEISFLVKDLSGKEAILKVLSNIGAEIESEGKFSEIKLAYPINKQLTAMFGFIIFKAEPASVTGIKKELQFAESILRTLLITPPPKKAVPFVRRSFAERNEARREEKSETVEIIEPVSEISEPVSEAPEENPVEEKKPKKEKPAPEKTEAPKVEEVKEPEVKAEEKEAEVSEVKAEDAETEKEEIKELPEEVKKEVKKEKPVKAPKGPEIDDELLDKKLDELFK